MIKLLEGMHLKGLMYQSNSGNSPYHWEFSIESMDETSGQFVGYCFYPSLHPTARVHCAGQFTLVEAADKITNDHVGKLSFSESTFVPGFADSEGLGLVENALDARLDLFLVPPGGTIQISATPTGHGESEGNADDGPVDAANCDMVNTSTKDVLNARGTWDTPNPLCGHVSEEPCFFSDAAFTSGGLGLA
jgi:hypothetical protein